jgi:flagellar hook-associated protein 3 FlgL
MSAIPGNLTRVPNILISQQALSALARTNVGLFRAQNDLSTGRMINRFSDDAVKAASISILDQRLDRSAQLQRNQDHADSSLSVLDGALGDASNLVIQAKNIASEEVGFGHSAAERSSEATVVDSLIQTLFGIANRQSVAGYIFGGSTPGTQPITNQLGGYQYNGQGSGLITDLGLGSDIPITLGGDNAIGSTSSRVQGTVDLNPSLTPATRLADLFGASGVGVSPGTIEFSFNGGPRTQIDLTGADTIGDVQTRITAALHNYEQANNVTILGPGGVSVSGGGVSIDVVPGASSQPNPTLQFYDLNSGVTGLDLGLVGPTPFSFSATSPNGLDAAPKLTWTTPISALAGVSGPLGSIKITNLGQSRTIDLSSAQTLGDIRNLIQGAGIGARVEINSAQNGINVLNETAAGSTNSMSIEEVSGSNYTATRLGIRSFSSSTLISDLNFGQGVKIANGNVNPTTGLADPSMDVDFTIKLGDSAGTTFPVDLTPADMLNIGTVIARINQQAQAAGINVPADFSAGISDSSNGIALTQNASYPTGPTIAAKNQSAAAQQLGLMDGTYDAAAHIYRGTDRAKVRVDNLFSTLIDLRDALRNNDTTGITLAGSELETHTDRLATTRALVGGYAKRVEDGTKLQQDQDVLDQQTKSQLQDTDFTEAAVRLNLLQTQLQAGLTVTAQSLTHSLLDYLG